MAQKEFNIYAYGFYKNDLTNTAYADHPYWIGVGGGFRPGNLDFSGQVVYVGGKRDFVVGNDLDYGSYAAEILVKYRIGPGLGVAVEGFYATGNDSSDPNKIKEYTYPTGTEAGYGFGNDRSIFFYYNSDFSYYWGQQLMASGTWYGRVNVEYNPIPRLNLNFNYLYIGDTAKGEGAGVKNVNAQSGTRLAARTDLNKDYVGSELSAIARIKIYESLGFNIGFGYFLPGEVYDSATRSADPAWAFLTRLRYIF
jgi:hypothetical protein